MQWSVGRYTALQGRAGQLRARRAAAGAQIVEYSEPHYACAHPVGAGGGLGDRIRAKCGSRSCLFLAAGVSDAVDGFLAKRFGMATALGAYLDPLADKAMLVSIYVALAIVGAIPLWLVILVVSRDIMIVSAVILSWVVDKPVKLKPHLVSKVNTVAQIVLALVVLASLAFNFERRTGNHDAHGAGGGLDLAFGCLLSRRMGAAYE